jgi:hypothetical protein
MSGMLAAMLGIGAGGGMVRNIVVGELNLSNEFSTSYYVGFMKSQPLGSMPDNTLPPLPGTIHNLYAYTSDPNYAVFAVYFTILNHSANSGWASLKIGNTTFNRSGATFSTSGSGASQQANWLWQGVGDPFTVGHGPVQPVTFTL